MKLTAAQIEQVGNQIEAERVLEEGPLFAEIVDEFGDHTFYLDFDGLYVLELVEDPNTVCQVANVVKMATWTDEEKTELRPHWAEPTSVFVKLDPEDSDFSA